MIRTHAEKNGDRRSIYGRKWFITGAGGARRISSWWRAPRDDKRKGITAFLYHKDQPGWRIVRRIAIMGPEEHGGHCELEFDGLEVHDDNVLGGVGDGLKVVAGAARPGAADALHALARLVQALHGDRAGLCQPTARASASSSPTAKACR